MSCTILTAEFSHESNTFSIKPGDLAAFKMRGILHADDAIAARGNANTPLAGFLEVAVPEGWRVIHAVSAAAAPSGPVTREAFDHIVGAITEAAQRHKTDLNGIALGLHGAMVTDFCDDGEGEILARLRAIVGPALPIAMTLDPHANVTERMARLADIIVAYKTYPHIDMRNCGRQAADILKRTMAGEIRPSTIRATRPMLEEVNGGRTDIGPMIARIAKALAYEQEPDVFAVSVNGGFGNADIAEVGPTVLVTGQGDMSRHRAFAETIMDDIWDRRHEPINSYLSVVAAVAEAQTHNAGAGPLVIADYADNPGGGGYGDSTNLLAALIAADVGGACFGPIVDPQTVHELAGTQPGTHVRVRLGGKTDAAVGGPPLDLEASLIRLSDGSYVGDGPMLAGLKGEWGPTAVLRIGDIEVLVVSFPQQMLDLQQFRAFGIDPAARRVVALKSMQHFRAAFEPIAGKVIVCDSGALCTPDLRKLTYLHVRRPMFPLDTI
ncbi:MAG: M81 family metallopeptidase [Hyphomicrobiales bacterium]|jgi:microcystin degradation protein MlrC|nr:M81 family metallopeptidase [Hyphomicrobiales bacterium]